MHKLKLSDEALNDMQEIKDYIARELDNPDAALKTVADIVKRLRMLQTNSKLGASLSDKIGMETDERYLVCGNYLAFYHESQESVHVDRVLYNRRNYQKLLVDHFRHQQ